MKKFDQVYESHLVIKEISVSPGREWMPGAPGWSVIQVKSGAGYWLLEQSNIELETGAVLLVADGVRGLIRASQLSVSGMSLGCFNVVPTRLTGLITLGELDFFQSNASRQELKCRVIPPQDALALKLKQLCAERNREGLLFRSKLLQLFVEAFGAQMEQTAPGRVNADSRKRLELFLRQTPPDALLEIDFKKLAEIAGCTSRHLNRIFHEVVGMSFRDKRAEIRLARARELLATSQSKVVEVALECGYNSLSLFNMMFTRRYGTSPGRWRQKHGINGGNNHQPGAKRGLVEKRKRPLYQLG